MQNVTEDKPLIDKVYEVLLREKQARNFYDLANAILSSDLEGNERNEVLARLYTTLNMDGRFLSVGQNFWGLKTWYPVEQHDEEVASKITPKRKRKILDDYDEDYFDDLDDEFDDLDDELDDTDYDDDDDDDLDGFDEAEIVEDDFEDDTEDDEEEDIDTDIDLEEDPEEDD